MALADLRLDPLSAAHNSRTFQNLKDRRHDLYQTRWQSPAGTPAETQLRRAPDVPPILSSGRIWSSIPQREEIGREEAVYRRTDHRLSA